METGYGQPFNLVRHIAGLRDFDLALDGPLIHGMSGGPIVERGGKVVGIGQSSDQQTGFGCGAEEIREFLKSN